MNYKKAALFIAADLAILLALLLFFAYHGLTHLLTMVIAAGMFFLAFYDLRDGNLSQLFSAFLGFPEDNQFKRYQWVPPVLAFLLLAISLPVLLEQGLVNSDQRWAMQQGGNFLRLALIASAGGGLVIVLAVFTVIKGGSKK